MRGAFAGPRREQRHPSALSPASPVLPPVVRPGSWHLAAGRWLSRAFLLRAAWGPGPVGPEPLLATESSTTRPPSCFVMLTAPWVPSAPRSLTCWCGRVFRAGCGDVAPAASSNTNERHLRTRASCCTSSQFGDGDVFLGPSWRGSPGLPLDSCPPCHEGGAETLRTGAPHRHQGICPRPASASRAWADFQGKSVLLCLSPAPRDLMALDRGSREHSSGVTGEAA